MYSRILTALFLALFGAFSSLRAQEAADLWHRDFLTGDWGGSRPRLSESGLILGLQEQSEVWGNAAGGLRRGATYDGLTTLSVGADLEKLAGWGGGYLYANALQVHGRGPSGSLVGNAQLASNVEAMDSTRLYEAYLEQTLISGALRVRLGQEGINDQMMLSQYAATFLNASFSYAGLPAVDLPSGGPAYPLAAPFVRAEYRATPALTLVGAVFSGDPAPAGGGNPQMRDANGLEFRMNGPVLGFAEAWYGLEGELPGTYKLGGWVHSGRFADQLTDTSGRPLASPGSNGVPAPHAPGYAVYAIADQMAWKPPGTKDQGIGVFAQVMGAPGRFNPAELFAMAGATWKGAIPGREDDVIGAGVAWLGISSALRRYGADMVRYGAAGSAYRGGETVIEATWLVQVSPWLALQPDLQVVVNPGCGIPSAYSGKALKDAVAGGVRATVTF